MKIFRLFMCIVAAGIGFISCKKADTEVQVVSLNQIGDEHYFGEKVLMWNSTDGEKHGISYEWKATGGYFLGFRVQDLVENVWVAPEQVGKYDVTATAKNGKSSSSKTATMNVTRYFFDNMQSPYLFTGAGWAGWTQANTVRTQLNSNNKLLSSLEVSPSRANTSNIDAVVAKRLDASDLRMPFSVRTKIGVRTTNAIATKHSFKSGAPFSISLTFLQPLKNADRPFIREIRWEIYPNPTNATSVNYQIRYEVYTPSKNTSVFSSAAGTYPAPIPLLPIFTGRNDALFTMTPNVAKNFTFSVAADGAFIAHVDGVEWFKSDGIKTWLAAAKAQYPDFEPPLGNQIRISLPGAASAATLLDNQIFINSLYINNDGTILSDPI